VITIGIDPTIELGPITIAWHGLMIAVGIVVGGVAVAHDTRRRGLDADRVYTIGLILVFGAIVGGRAFYLLEHGQLADPGAWFSTPGSRSTEASSPPLPASSWACATRTRTR
jgi:phosphatidylglycerol:prolipoprotein diacylglycerol transferase